MSCPIMARGFGGNQNGAFKAPCSPCNLSLFLEAPSFYHHPFLTLVVFPHRVIPASSAADWPLAQLGFALPLSAKTKKESESCRKNLAALPCKAAQPCSAKPCASTESTHPSSGIHLICLLTHLADRRGGTNTLTNPQRHSPFQRIYPGCSRPQQTRLFARPASRSVALGTL